MLHFGVLGTARVVSYGLVKPAREVAGVAVSAVASRSIERARSFAQRLAIPRALGSYEALLDDPSIDAVYVALPTALHATWALKALEAGKHVLCEKPLATNALDAAELARCAARTGRVLAEAMHARYLRKLHRQRELVATGDYGRPLRLQSCFRVVLVRMPKSDYRRSFELGGGAGLDLGCYAVSCLRYVAGEEPTVVSAQHRLIAPEVDRWMRATCRFPSGADAVIECGFRGAYVPRMGVTVTCEKGSIAWTKAGLALRRNGRVVHEALPRDRTFRLQLDAFAKRVRGEPSPALPPEDAVATARVVQAMYAAAGLAPRPRVL